MEYISYAQQQLSISQIKMHAKQYDGVNMWELIGIDENEFPFLIWQSDEDFTIMYWSKRSGMIEKTDDDPVRNYAFACWLDENAHPVFASTKDAQKYAEDRDWPRI